MTRRRVFLALMAVALLTTVFRAVQLRMRDVGNAYQIGLVYNEGALPANQAIFDVYESVLREEGVPHRWVTARDLSLIEGGDLRNRYRALIFPDALAQYLPQGVETRVRQFLEAGGNVAVIFDAGIREASGAFRPGGLFAPLLGVEYLRYEELREDAYIQGNLRFKTPDDAAAWHIPPGKLDRKQVVGGYAYGGLEYPIVDAEATADDLRIYAGFKGIPIISMHEVGAGKAFWANVPLGFLKAYSDDMPIRTFLRTFLFDHVKIPHLSPAPGGVGGLVIDWHIDSAVEWEGVPALIRHGLVRPGLVQEFDVTAGPDRDEPGDSLGFDACGRGRRYLKQLIPYGEIGSHGGWAHNYFSDRLNDKKLSPAEIERAVRRNNSCLESVTGKPVRSYAAPNGVHPQPLMTEILERQGIEAYYYTGDTGSPPNRTFFDARMVAPDVWAFPVTPNGLNASIGEMIRAKLGPDEVLEWLNSTLDLVVEDRTVRLVYSHPYDLLRPDYRAAFLKFLDRVEDLEQSGRLTVQSMPYFTEFGNRLVKTRYSFVPRNGQLAVELWNPDGLRDIALSVPGEMLEPGAEPPPGVSQHESGGDRVFTVTSDVNYMEFGLPLAGS